MSYYELTNTASAFYDGGWRKEDKELMVEVYGMAEAEAEEICAVLAKYEAKE